MKSNRRDFLLLGAAAVSLPAVAHTKGGAALPRLQPCGLADVRLLPGSPFHDALQANLGYLMRLQPERLLHNFRVHAGLAPKGAAYGGWEADTIAGHTLGHYLTALSLMHAQTGDAACKARALAIVDELRACQLAAGDRYVAGFTRRVGDRLEDGKAIFPEILRGEIRAQGFDLNGCWVPLYNWHKLFTGLFAAQDHCRSTLALTVARELGGYIAGVFEALTDDQVQTVLSCEHGGLNESFAELHARTQAPRWLALAERIRHHKTLGPLFVQEDRLQGLHANTQIPKVVGLARLFELTGREEYRTASRFFWETVTQHHSFVIGGNSDREYFQPRGRLANYVTDQTCESCNTHNMLRLTRHLFAERPDARYFDYYERAHFNHMLAHQNPHTGHFAYMVPLMSGAARDWSSDEGDFWCCVGTGMETHAKHGESIYWQAPGHLLVNLFIPSRLRWAQAGARIELETAYPYEDTVTLRLAALARPRVFALSLRVPAWSPSVTLTLNGRPIHADIAGGYATVRRKWRRGDALSLKLVLQPRVEPIVDDEGLVAILNGPLVLAADLGDPATPFNGAAPALVGSGPVPLADGPAPRTWVVPASGARPGELMLRPFYAQWERRTAVYFRRYNEDGWTQHERAAQAEATRRTALDARSLDAVRLGDLPAEQAHGLQSKFSYDLTYRLRPGRDARSGGFFEFTMACDAEAAMQLQATYWGEEVRRSFHILVDGVRIATETLGYAQDGVFVERDYPIEQQLTRGRSKVRVRFEPEPGHTAGPVFGVRLVRQAQ